MKKLFFAILLMTSLVAAASADFRLSLTTNEHGQLTPVVTYPVGKLTNPGGLKLSLDVIGFAGMNLQSNRPVVAGAVVYRFKAAREADLILGPAARFENGRARLGAYIGLEYRS